MAGDTKRLLDGRLAQILADVGRVVWGKRKREREREREREISFFPPPLSLLIFVSGHMVPMDQPAHALSMLQTFLDNKPFYF